MLVMEKPNKKQVKEVVELLKQYHAEYKSPLATSNYKMNKALDFFEGKPSKIEQVISLLEALNK